MQQMLGSQGQVCEQGNAKGRNKPEAIHLGLHHCQVAAVGNADGPA